MSDELAERLRQLQSEIDALQAGITALAALPAEQERLRVQLADKQRQFVALQQTGCVNYGVGTTVNHQGDNVSGNKIIQNYGPADTPGRDTLRLEYLRGLCGQCNRLSLADADSSDPTRAAVELAAVYTRLEVAGTVKKQGDEPQRYLGGDGRQGTALEAASVAPRLVLLGEPGSGKSTFINYLTLCLAQAAQGNNQWLERLGPGWSRGPLLPIRVVLREFAAWLVARPKRPPRGDANLFWLYLISQHGKELHALLREQVAAGLVLLLLDGLDEVPADAAAFPLQVVVETIQALAATAGPSPLLVTCRILDYEQDTRRQLPGWTLDRIIAFSPELRREFIAR